jgi:hypothetical protein
MKVRRKSLHRSTNAKRAKKFAAMRAAKERKRLAALTAPVEMPDTSHAYQPPHPKPLFVITIRCRDGAFERVRIYDGIFGLSPSATAAARKVAAVLANYRPAPETEKP